MAKIRVPDEVLKGIIAVRDSGLANMLDKPVVGFGLGAQILSIAADGASAEAPLALRVDPATRVLDNALGGFLPPAFPQVVYMRDAPRPPGYATVMARNPAGAPAVFSVGPKAFGFCGNPGIRRAMIEDQIMESDDTPDDTGSVLAALGEQGSAPEDALVPIMAGLVAAFGFRIA